MRGYVSLSESAVSLLTKKTLQFACKMFTCSWAFEVADYLNSTRKTMYG